MLADKTRTKLRRCYSSKQKVRKHAATVAGNSMYYCFCKCAPICTNDRRTAQHGFDYDSAKWLDVESWNEYRLCSGHHLPTLLFIQHADVFTIIWWLTLTGYKQAGTQRFTDLGSYGVPLTMGQPPDEEVIILFSFSQWKLAHIEVV